MNSSFALETPIVVDTGDISESSEKILGCQRLDAAIWYQFYVQRDGMLYTSTWIRGDDAGFPASADVQFELGALPPGSYEFWVQAWEPAGGLSPWSDPDTFEVTCAPIMAPSPYFPRGGNLQDNGYWPAEYVFSNPAAATNPTATWGQFQIKPSSASFDDPAETFSQWVEYDFPGQNGVAFEQTQGLAEFLSDGTYDWRCQEYSPCAGIGDWSGSAWGDVSGTDCSEIEPLSNVSYFFGGDGFGNEPGEHLFHSGSFQTAAGNTPSLNLNFDGVPWIRIFIRHATTQEVVFFEWIQFTADYNLRMPKLKPGIYEVWTQSHHHQCGVSAWSNGPVAQFTVRQPSIQPVALAGTPTRDLRGIGHFGFRAQGGIDWYQLYVTCGDAVILNQWFDLEDRTPGALSLERIVSQAIPGSDPQRWAVILEQPCVSPLVFWVRGYSLTGEFSEWVSYTDLAVYNEDAPFNLSLEVDGMSWTNSSGSTVGDVQLYVQRNGVLYYEDVAEAQFVSSNTEITPWVDLWSTPTAYQPFFDFAPGAYKVWVKNSASGNGPWSEPLEIQIEP